MARYTAPVQRPLRLVPVIAFAALVVPLLAASLVDACPRSHGRYSGGQPAANCGGQRIGPVTFSVRTLRSSCGPTRCKMSAVVR